MLRRIVRNVGQNHHWEPGGVAFAAVLSASVLPASAFASSGAVLADCLARRLRHPGSFDQNHVKRGGQENDGTSQIKFRRTTQRCPRCAEEQAYSSAASGGP